MQDATLVFDLDGTLVETAPDLIGSVNHVLALKSLAPIADDQLRPEISFGAAHMLRRAFRLHDAGLADDEILALYEHEFLPHYAANIAVASRPFPGLEGALDEARRRGARCAVCTNKWEGLSRQLLAALGLADHFAAIAGRDTFEVFKPNPQHLLGTISLAGGDPGRSIMIGDSATDVETARAAGIPVVGVTFGYTDIPMASLGADAVIDHYDELLPAVELLLGGRRTAV